MPEIGDEVIITFNGNGCYFTGKRGVIVHIRENGLYEIYLYDSANINFGIYGREYRGNNPKYKGKRVLGFMQRDMYDVNDSFTVLRKKSDHQ